VNIIVEHPLDMPTLAQIQSLESTMRAAPAELHREIPVTHHFAPGVYCREITIPAGVCIVGKLHRTQHLISLLCGEVTIFTDRGMERITGPRVWTTYPGTKRAIFAHTDATLMTIHVTDETDVDVIESQIIEPELLEHERKELT
jgi:hypothetical protein